MRKRLGWILLIIGIALISYGGYKSFVGKDTNSINNVPISDNQNNEDEETVSSDTLFNGVYQMDKTIIKLYQIDKNTLAFNISYDEGSGEVSSTAKITGNTAKEEMFDNKYYFMIGDNNIDFDTNREELDSGKYNKVSNYSLSDYFHDNYGDEKYFNSKYNGEYSQGTIKAYMYQSDEDEVRVVLIKGLSSSDLRYDIGEDGVLSCADFEDVYEIAMNENGFTFKDVNGDSKGFDGEYTKVKSLTMEEAIKNMY